MSIAASPAIEGANESESRASAGLPLLNAGLAWIGYLFSQSGALFLGSDSIQSSLLRLAAGVLYGLGAVLMYVSFRTSARWSALIQMILNLVAMCFFTNSVLAIMSVQPDYQAFHELFSNTQVLMALAVFFIARCLQRDRRIPNWLAWLFYAYAIFGVVQTASYFVNIPLFSSYVPAIVISLVVELTFAFTLVRAGSIQMHPRART